MAHPTSSSEVRNHDDVVFLVITADVSICMGGSMLQFIVFGMKQGFKFRFSSQFHRVTCHDAVTESPMTLTLRLKSTVTDRFLKPWGEEISYVIYCLRAGQSNDLTKEDCKETSSVVVCFGEMLIDFVPMVGGVSLAEAPAFKKAPGGAPANVAVGISRLGSSSAFIGKVGADEFGYMLADILKQNNVETSGMRFDSNARTALAFVTLRADGEREFLFFRNPSADMLLQESELDKDLLKKARIFHYGSISLIDEPCKSAHLAAMSIAKNSGCILSYDPNLRLALWPSADAARKGIMDIWDQADVIKISEDEITFLTGGDDPYDDNVVLKKLFHPNLKLLIVTEGSQGCRYYTKAFKGRVSGVKVKPVDTTGAGDAFVSGILHCIASDQTIFQDEKRLRKALYFANVCGALTVTQRGAIPALPTKEAILQFLLEAAVI
ncbi:hypothetical protein JHK85_025823 [Glycine max]|nr:hypothetical protein JHK85_025823 [Glycine max]KHN23057.1 Putative fructokinase-5 [Glycine soja]RZB92112.1 putative fructokinase-7 isoform B [Glycine soja]